MVLHQANLFEAGSTGKALYGFMSNRLETSMLAIFISLSHNSYGVAAECLSKAIVAYNLMLPLLPTLAASGPWMFGTRYEYLNLQAVVLNQLGPIISEKLPEDNACAEWWSQWDEGG